MALPVFCVPLALPVLVPKTYAFLDRFAALRSERWAACRLPSLSKQFLRLGNFDIGCTRAGDSGAGAMLGTSNVVDCSRCRILLYESLM